jgi:hypothetical protein
MSMAESQKLETANGREVEANIPLSGTGDLESMLTAGEDEFMFGLNVE